MHVTWWDAVTAALVVCAATSEATSSLRKARLLRETVDKDGGTYRYSDAFANQRLSYRRKMLWLLPIGSILALGLIRGGILDGWTGHEVPLIAIALWILTTGVVGWVCMRILGPPAPAARSSGDGGHE